jgi:hypothetical protein
MDVAAFALGLVVGVVFTAALGAGAMIARAGSVGRAFWGLTVAGRANLDPTLTGKIDAVLGGATPAAPPPPAPKKPSGEPLRVLALLQSEARLIDFLMEDISGASAEQVGNAVKDIHHKARQALNQHLVIDTVLTAKEGESVTLQPGFDPSAVRVVGNVTGQPPFTGEVQHPGWTVREIKLPAVAEGQDPMVLQPAEVQLP